MGNRKLEVGIAVVVALAVIALFFVYANPFTMSGTQDSTNGQGALDAALQGQQTGTGTSNPTQLVAQDEQVGTGDTAAAGDTITVDYTGRLQDGTVFDSSVGKTPFTFQLGVGQVIAGWDQGVQGMKVGGKRILVIPANLAYGAQAVGPIPANSTLIFEVTLLKVQKGQ